MIDFVPSVMCSLVTLILGVCIDVGMAFILQDVQRTLLFKFTCDAVNLVVVVVAVVVLRVCCGSW